MAAGAASAAALPPGSRQARNVAFEAVMAATRTPQACDACDARCGGGRRSTCADGLGILRAVLAAGVREAVDPDGRSVARSVVSALLTPGSSRVSAERALTALQALHAAGVDVVTAGPADPWPILHSAAIADAPAAVRWLVSVAGAPLEERDIDGYTSLLHACSLGQWAAAHALLDCGARVDVQSTDEQGWWPVLAAVESAKFNDTLLRRLLTADSDSLLRCMVGGASALHVAAVGNTPALNVLLGSGLPHMAEAINAVAAQPPGEEEEQRVVTKGTPLHIACGGSNWDAALALLAAGARVDITGDIEGKLQTIAELARRSPACKHRGVKLAIAARAREHAAAKARQVCSAPPGPARGGSVDAQSDTSCASCGGGGLACSGSELPSVTGESAGAAAACASAAGDGSTAAAGSGLATTAATNHTAGAGKQVSTGRKGRARGARNRTEEWPDDGSVSAAAAALPAVDGIVAALPLCDGPNTCEVGACAAVDAALAPSVYVSLPPSFSPADEPPAPAGGLPDAEAAAPASCAAAPGVASAINTCEPSGVAETTPSGCGSCNGCEGPGGSRGSRNTCEPGPTARYADATASAESLQSVNSSDTTVSSSLAALRDDGASAAAVRAALAELARDPGAAAALVRRGAMLTVMAAMSRHGVAVARAAGPLLIALGSAAEAAAEAGGGQGQQEGEGV